MAHLDSRGYPPRAAPNLENRVGDSETHLDFLHETLAHLRLTRRRQIVDRGATTESAANQILVDFIVYRTYILHRSRILVTHKLKPESVKC